MKTISECFDRDNPSKEGDYFRFDLNPSYEAYGTKIITRVHYDFGFNLKYLSWYVPLNPYFLELCIYSLNASPVAIKRATDEMRVTFVNGLSSNNLISTGRVFIYGERELTETEKNTLCECAMNNCLVLEFRGPNYVDRQVSEEGLSTPDEMEAFELMQLLDRTSSGNSSADKYHQLILRILSFVFHGLLDNPVKEQKIYEGRKRVDISFDNKAQQAFFFDLKFHHDIKCPYIFFECKNYSKEIGNPELDQLAGRFSSKFGRFGILVCRNIADKPLLLSRCRDVLNADRGCILFFDDSDIKSLLGFRGCGDLERIDKLLRSKLKELLL